MAATFALSRWFQADDATTAKEVAVLPGHEAEVNSAAFSPDSSRIVTASGDQTARIWDAATGAEIAVLRGHEDQVFAAAFSSSGAQIVTASADQTARIWDAAGKTARDLARAPGSSAVGRFSPDGLHHLARLPRPQSCQSSRGRSPAPWHRCRTAS